MQHAVRHACGMPHAAAAFCLGSLWPSALKAGGVQRCRWLPAVCTRWVGTALTLSSPLLLLLLLLLLHRCVAFGLAQSMDGGLWPGAVMSINVTMWRAGAWPLA